MEFKELFYHQFMQGVPLRRQGWGHYWIRRDFGTIDIVNPNQGTIEKMTDRDDIIFIIENLLKDDWEIANDVIDLTKG